MEQWTMDTDKPFPRHLSISNFICAEIDTLFYFYGFFLYYESSLKIVLTADLNPDVIAAISRIAIYHIITLQAR